MASDVNGIAFLDELLMALHALLVEARRADARSSAAVADLPEQASPSVPDEPPERESGGSVRPPPRGRRYGFAAVGGVDSEIWSGQIGAAIGGHMGARLSSRTGWGTELDGGVVWALGSSQSVAARTLRTTLRVDYAPVEILRIALGLDARILIARSSGATSPIERDGATFGVIAAARYGLRVDRFEVLAGPQAEILRVARPRAGQRERGLSTSEPVRGAIARGGGRSRSLRRARGRWITRSWVTIPTTARRTARTRTATRRRRVRSV